MVKATAAAQGWPYEQHNHFHRAISRVRQSTGNDRLRLLQGRAEILHVNFYDVLEDLDAAQIEKDLEDMADLLRILEPLTDAG